MTVESSSIKASEGLFGGNQLDPEASVSTEDKMKFRRMTQIIRVYYIVGQSANEQIGTFPMLNFRTLNIPLLSVESNFVDIANRSDT